MFSDRLWNRSFWISALFRIGAAQVRLVMKLQTSRMLMISQRIYNGLNEWSKE